MGRAEIETYLVNYDYAAGAPTDATFSCLFEDGRRGWATSQDASLLQAIEREEFCGRRAQVRAGALLEID